MSTRTKAPVDHEHSEKISPVPKISRRVPVKQKLRLVKSQNDKMARLQFEFTKRQLEMFDETMVECGLSTRKELFNYAMTFLKWGLNETRAGKSIASVRGTDEPIQILKMPIFDHIEGTTSAKI